MEWFGTFICRIGKELKRRTSIKEGLWVAGLGVLRDLGFFFRDF